MKQLGKCEHRLDSKEFLNIIQNCDYINNFVLLNNGIMHVHF